MKTEHLRFNNYNFRICQSKEGSPWVVSYVESIRFNSIYAVFLDEKALTEYQAALGLLWNELNRRNYPCHASA